MSAVNNIAAERGKRHKKRIDRLQLDFSSDRRWSRDQSRTGQMEVEPTNGTAGGTTSTTSSTVPGTDEAGTGTAEGPSDPRPGTRGRARLDAARSLLDLTSEGDLTAVDEYGRVHRDNPKGPREHESNDSPHAPTCGPTGDMLRPPLSFGDPKQFILRGSIGDRQVRVLVDTGATISFLSRELVGKLKPKPEVKKSELSVMMGNGDTQDTNHYVEVDLVLNNTSLPGQFHLLDLPSAFDAIAGLDWLAKHGVHINARARTVTIEGAVGSVGKRINVAGCAAISLGMPTKIDGTDWGDLNHTLCYLGPGESIRTDGDDVSHVEVKTGNAFQTAVDRYAKVEGVMVMTDLWMQPPRVNRRDRRVRKASVKQTQHLEEQLANFSHQQRQAYMASSTETEKGMFQKLQQEFKDIQVNVLPESEINKTHAPHKEWSDQLLANVQKYRCVGPMPETVLMEGDDPLTIEDKPGLTTRPPHRQYKTPRHLLPELEKFITEMLEKKWIEPSKSEYSSPVLIIPKPNGKGYRFVVDLRQVNERTKRINYYMPDITGMFDKLKGAAFTSCLDLQKGYWQAPLDPKTKHKTAFSCEFGSFQYRVVPMGLISSAQYYQSFVEKKLDRHGILYKKVHASSDLSDTYLDSDGVRCKGYIGVFIDDLIVFSSSADLHRKHLLSLFEVLSIENLYLNPDKCHLFARYVRFLGCVVGQNSIYMDGEKIKAILEMPEPRQTQSEVRAFLGAVSFYRRWLSDFSEMSAPLVEMLKGKEKSISGRWGTRQSEAVLALKRAITRYPVLRQFDQTKQIFVVTDASDYAIGGCLYQHHDGKPCAVQYISRQMTPAEKNYDVREKECLAIKYCLEKLRHYLLCTTFTIKCLSDHRSLTFLKNGREMGGRIARWALSLGEYQYEIEYIKGTDNALADVLSRMVAAEARGLTGQHKPNRKAEKSTLANMTPEIAAAVELARTNTLDERANHVITREAAKDVQLFGTRLLPPRVTFDASNVKVENMEQTHECVMFATARYRSNVVKIRRDDYLTCNQFGTIYAVVEQGGLRGQLTATTNASSNGGDAEGGDSGEIPSQGEKKRVSSTKVPRPVQDTRAYTIRDGLLYLLPSTHGRKGGEKLCIPNSTNGGRNGMTLRLQMVADMHDNALACHTGVDRTLTQLKNRVYWPSMKTDVEEYISACPECQRFKVDRRRPQGHAVPTQIPLRPGTHYSLDFMSGLPKSGRQAFDAILVVVDRFSKKVRCLPTWKKASGKLVAELFVNHVVLGSDGQGVPLEIISDRDARFTPTNAKAKVESFWKEFFSYIGTSIRLSTARHQRTDGTTERMIAHIQDMMRIGIDYKQSNWVTLLPRLLFTINSNEARATGLSPFFVERGREPLLKLDRDKTITAQAPQREDTEDFLKRIWAIDKQVEEKLVATKEYQAAKWDKDVARKAHNFVPGDQVWLSTKGITMPWDKERKSKKLTARFYGPFEVIRQTSEVTYELDLPKASNIHPIFHVALLKPVTSLKDLRAPALPKGEDGDEYEIESILAHRKTKGGKKKYLVKWKGYTFEESTWEPQENFKGSALQKYHTQIKEAKNEESTSEEEMED